MSFRIVLTVAVVAVFGAVGYVVAVARPFHLPGDVALIGRDGSRRAEDEKAAQIPEAPVPPYTDLTSSTSTQGGLHRRYESQLSAEGLWLFYTNEMPTAGWRRDTGFDVANAASGLSQPVLSFKAGRARCIIGLEESGPATTVVHVLVVAPPGQ